MQGQHIACQWNGQAARLILNKCRGCAAHRPYVRLRPLAYVTCSRPRGSIGSPLGRGAEAYTIRSGHVLALDPRLALIKAWVFSVPESQDPAVSGPDPTQRGLDPILGVRFAHVGSWTLPGGPVCIYRGPALSHGGSDSLLIPWSISSSLATWRPRNHPCGGVGCCCWPRVVARGWGEPWSGPTHSSFSTRLKIAAWVLFLHTVVRGTPVLGY
jgi:hypothetical protein